MTSPPQILGLLADPLRWKLIGELGRSDRRVSELVELVGKPQNVISYHLAEMRDAGIASARRSSADGRDVYYRVDLLRCRDLLGESGTALHAALSLAPSAVNPILASGVTGAMSRTRSRTRSRLLFLCTGNSARSQMAEAFVEYLSEGRVEAQSAGSQPKPLHTNAVRAMAEHGIDIAGRPTKPLTRFTRSRFDRVITLCDKVREICPEFPGSPIAAHWSIADPASAGKNDRDTYATFQSVADEIETRVALLLAEIAS